MFLSLIVRWISAAGTQRSRRNRLEGVDSRRRARSSREGTGIFEINSTYPRLNLAQSPGRHSVDYFAAGLFQAIDSRFSEF